MIPEPRKGSRGQVLCDGCRRCVLGYHCGPCSAAWRQRAASRSRMRSRHRKETARAVT